MRVLHLLSEIPWRGGENQCRLLAKGLKAQFHYEQWVATPIGSEAQRRMSREFPIKAYSSIWSPLSILGLWLFIHRKKIQILHAHTSKAHTLGLILRLLSPQTKLIVHRRVDYVPKQNLRTKLKYHSPLIRSWIAISAKVRDILMATGISDSKIKLIPSSVAAQEASASEQIAAKQALCERYHIPENVPLIGNASALSDQKGYEILLEACAILRSRHREFRCLIAGKGPKEKELKALCRKLNLDKHVYFVGWIDNPQRFLAGLDILALSSHYEGLGTIVQEAIYAGCCIVATNTGGVPEMIKNGETGLLVDCGNPQAFSVALERALESKELQYSLNVRGREYLKSYFSLAFMVEATHSVYRNALLH